MVSTGAGAGRAGGGVEPGWGDEQRALYAAYVGRRAGGPRPVKILWWTAAARQRPDVMGLVSRLWAGRPTRPDEDQVFVALFHPADPVGARPFLVVRARPGSLAEGRGRAIATVVGRAEPGGALVLETRRGTVLPAEPPGLAGDDAPAWSEVDPAG